MKSIKIIRALIATGFIGIFANCGGGSPGGTIGIDGSGEPPKTAVSGPINGFGSIIVNGVRYNTDNAYIYIGETLANEQLLDVGDYVTVIGTKNSDGISGVAQSVHYQPNVKGPISAISLADNTITVLGQTLVLTSDTTFGAAITPRDISGLSIGDTVEVSGPRDSSNRLITTRVDYIEEGEIELTGTIYDLVHETQSFYVNGVQVNFAQSGLSGEIANGLNVLVIGANYTNGVLFSESVQSLKDYRNLIDVPEIEHSGYVTEYFSEDHFRVGDIIVRTFPETEIINNSGSPLGLDSQVRILGFFENDNSFHANRMEIVKGSALKLHGPITQISDDDSASIHGHVMVQDILAEVNTATRLYNVNGENNDRLYYSDLRVGDQVVVTGFIDNNLFIATALELEANDLQSSTQQLIGYPFNIDYDAQQFEMYDIVLRWNNETQFGIDNQLSPETVVQHGANLEVSGFYEGDIFVAERINQRPN